MKGERYIVTTQLGGRTRQLIWDASEPLRLEPGEVSSLRKAHGLRAASFNCSDASKPGALHISRGAGGEKGLYGFDRLSNRYVGRSEAGRVFTLKKKRNAYQLCALHPDLVLHRLGVEPRRFKTREKLILSEADLLSSSLGLKLNWWRWSRVAVDALPKLKEADSTATPFGQEEQEFKRITGKVFATSLALSLCVLLIPWRWIESHNQPPPSPEPVSISLKKPKIVALTPRSHPVETHPAPVQAAPARPAPVHKARPRPVPPKPKAPEITAAQIQAQLNAKKQAQAKNDLSKALGFLGKPTAKAPVEPVKNTSARYQALDSSAPTTSKESSRVLSNLAQTTNSDGPIQTKGSRTMDAAVAVSGGGLKGVQGKVALDSISGTVRAADAASILSSRGMSISGEGQVEESEIEKALAKRLQQFQYCYEKALLSNPSLAGTVTAQWTIGAGGSASDVKIVRSQLRNEGLHQCIAKEIRNVRFPTPSGGAVTLTYPFAFSSTTM